MNDQLLTKAEQLMTVFFNGLPDETEDPMNQMQMDEPSETGRIRIWVADDCTVCIVSDIEGQPHVEMAEAICNAGSCIRDLFDEIKRLRDIVESKSVNRLQELVVKSGFKYWRASDSHGVRGTREQAEEFIADLIGVEVEITESKSKINGHPPLRVG